MSLLSNAIHMGMLDVSATMAVFKQKLKVVKVGEGESADLSERFMYVGYIYRFVYVRGL